MKHLANCRICRKPLFVELDDAYSELGDYLKLLPMATHNHCHDRAYRHNVLVEAFSKVCMDLNESLRINPNVNRDGWRRGITKLTKDYSKWMADAHRSTCVEWTEEFVDLILERPGQWYKILDTYRAEWKKKHLNP